MIIVLTICLLLLFAASTLCSQQSLSEIQERIKKIKNQLGDKLLTTADKVIARHVEAVGGMDAILAVKTLMFKARILFGGHIHIWHAVISIPTTCGSAGHQKMKAILSAMGVSSGS